MKMTLTSVMICLMSAVTVMVLIHIFITPEAACSSCFPLLPGKYLEKVPCLQKLLIFSIQLYLNWAMQLMFFLGALQILQEQLFPRTPQLLLY